MPPTHVAQGWTIASDDSTQIKIGDEGYSMAITLNGRGLHLLHVPPGVSLDARAGAVRLPTALTCLSGTGLPGLAVFTKI